MLQLHSSLQSALNADPYLETALLISMGRKNTSALLRTTHRHNLSWNAQTWVADGLFLRADSVPQPSRVAATNWTFYLSGINVLSQEAFERQEASLYVAYISQGDVIGDAVLVGRGVMNIGDIQETLDEVLQPIDVEMLWNRGSRSTTHARTDEGQQQRFPGDRAFKDIHTQREVTIGGAGVNVFR